MPFLAPPCWALGICITTKPCLASMSFRLPCSCCYEGLLSNAIWWKVLEDLTGVTGDGSLPGTQHLHHSQTVLSLMPNRAHCTCRYRGMHVAAGTSSTDLLESRLCYTQTPIASMRNHGGLHLLLYMHCRDSTDARGKVAEPQVPFSYTVEPR